MRELKNEEFGEFLKYIEQRKPEIQELLNAANDLVNAAFYNPASCAVSVPTSFSSILNISREIASVPPGNNNRPGSATSEGALAVVQPVYTQYDNPLKTPDAFSGPDLDALLTHSYQQAAKCLQPMSIYHHCYLWPSVRFDESEDIDELPTWFPRLQQSPRPPRRYQILPFYYTERWQLAVFDVVEYILVCYDTTWTSGSPESTFLVSQAFLRTYGI